MACEFYCIGRADDIKKSIRHCLLRWYALPSSADLVDIESQRLHESVLTNSCKLTSYSAFARIYGTAG